MIAADTLGPVGIPDCIFDAVGRRGRVGIFGAPSSGRVRLIVAPVPGFHPLAYHASATASRGLSHPSPPMDLSPQNFPNACLHTAWTSAGHSPHFRFIYQPCLSRIRPIIRPAMSCRSGMWNPLRFRSAACFSDAMPEDTRRKYSSRSCLPCP